MKNRYHLSVARFFVMLMALFSVTYAQEATTEQQLDDLINRLEKGESIENMTVNLRDVYFEFESAAIDPSSGRYLDKVVVFLNKVPNIDLQIEGHTDNIGTAEVNERLSRQRAESVKNYLVLNGISVDRIQATGYGQNTPVATNTTPEGRALNRRVEFRVIRKQTMASIQDFIYLRTGEIMGVRVISVNENEVRYRTFHDDTEYTVSSSSVIKVVYASGDSWYSPKPEAVVTANSKPKANSELVATLKWFGRFFTGVPGYYGKHASLFSAQYEYRDNLIGGMKYDSMIYIQPVAIGYERQLYRNFGLGVNASLHMWGAPEQELRYTYGALTARLLYHPYVAKRIDPYVGIAGTLRAIQLNQPEWPAKRWVNVSYDWVAGCRFFPARRMGIFGEIGSDGIAKYSAGLILVFGQLSEDW